MIGVDMIVCHPTFCRVEFLFCPQPADATYLLIPVTYFVIYCPSMVVDAGIAGRIALSPPVSTSCFLICHVGFLF